LKRSFTIIISALLLTLFTLCSYIGFKSHPAINMEIYNNDQPTSIKNDFNVKEVIYSNEEVSPNLSGLSQADLIFEYINNIGKNSYKALFTKNIPSNIHPSVKIKDATIKYIPKFNYLDKNKPSEKYNIAAKSIFINFNNLCSSNFIYNGEYYMHYKDTIKDIDSSNNSPLQLSNIIVQFIDKEPWEYNIETDIGNGNGYIFTGGKGIQIKWNKEYSNPIKFTDNSYNPIFFSSGLTWWIFLDKNSSIVIN
jgi:hypothetical protein